MSCESRMGRGWTSHPSALTLQDPVRSHQLHLGLENLLLAPGSMASAAFQLGAGTQTCVGAQRELSLQGQLRAGAMARKSVSSQPPPLPKFPNTAILPPSDREVPHHGGSQPKELMEIGQMQLKALAPLPLQGPAGHSPAPLRNTLRKLFQQPPPRRDNSISPSS